MKNEVKLIYIVFIIISLFTIIWYFRHGLYDGGHHVPKNETQLKRLANFDMVLTSFLYTDIIMDDQLVNATIWMHSSNPTLTELIKMIRSKQEIIGRLSKDNFEGKDIWGNSLVYQFVPHEYIKIYSIGENEVDENGQGDDIKFEIDISWYKDKQK